MPFGHDWERAQKRYASYRKRQDRIAAARSIATHEDREWFAMALIFPTCLRCGDKGRKIGKDHIIPICHGGSDAIENIQPLCRNCNSAKHGWEDYRPEGWRQKIDALLSMAESL